MARATYEDIQTMKHRLAKILSDFSYRFPDTAIALSVKTEIKTQHGIETINIKLTEVPAVEQGELPGMNDEVVLVDPAWKDLRKKYGNRAEDD